MKKLFFIITASLCFCACHKDPATPLLEEHPIEDYIYNNAKDVSVIAMPNQGGNDIGFQFLSSKKGKIVKLGCRNPNIGNVDSAAVSLWDADSHDLVLRKMIMNTDPSNFIYANLEATNEVVNIPANKNYVVSMHLYGRQNPTLVYRLVKYSFKLIIPLTDRAITINNQLEGAAYSFVPTYPTFVFPASDNNDVYGLPDIGFEPIF